MIYWHCTFQWLIKAFQRWILKRYVQRVLIWIPASPKGRSTSGQCQYFDIVVCYQWIIWRQWRRYYLACCVNVKADKERWAELNFTNDISGRSINNVSVPYLWVEPAFSDTSLVKSIRVSTQPKIIRNLMRIIIALELNNDNDKFLQAHCTYCPM